MSISSLRHVMAVNLAVELYTLLDDRDPPRFANCRLHLPCIVFPVTEVIRRPTEDMQTCFTYQVKADGLHDLTITMKRKLPRPARQSFLLVRPWDRRLLELPDYADDAESVDDFDPLESPGGQGPVDSELSERAMRLIVRLGQPFSAFLLVLRHGKEYKRIASDHNIIAQVKDVHGMINVKTIEIL
ncbi:uncharacterized protein F5891DRAFT_1055481 [Suillus fuscotomentosus]|uniref:Uncharacterized protein n=1 Tax=Suillus fuscotomentosus TaxID=1912939 RepID=A0AAD4HH07_9AGAM|nr:uncharacterized protein F5891DRAFT_1055481 [Suillus fuscotomentosus]KAG1896172.1 hypothetical protein F5891DRAFT_1055481 [Suillus fuscotomentosus]